MFKLSDQKISFTSCFIILKPSNIFLFSYHFRRQFKSALSTKPAKKVVSNCPQLLSEASCGTKILDFLPVPLLRTYCRSILEQHSSQSSGLSLIPESLALSGLEALDRILEQQKEPSANAASEGLEESLLQLLIERSNSGTRAKIVGKIERSARLAALLKKTVEIFDS